jgi:CubicO group peptidase (beta-lactamase class C family)
MRETHTPRRDAGRNMQIGLAWHIMSRPSGNIVWHNGGTGGYRSYVGFDPVRRLGVVLLSNVGNATIDDLGFHLLDETFPLQAPPQRRTEIALDSLVLARYVGDYEVAPTFRITVTREGAQLFAQATGQSRFAIYAESDSTFFLKVVDAQITFRADGLVLHQNGQHLPGRKVQ